jgi:peptide/nickel transport system permease protein
MRIFILKRLLAALPILLCASAVTFFLMHASPGDFLTQLRANPEFSAEYIHSVELQLGLDRPAVVQYFAWLKRLLHLDLGCSWTYHLPVIELVGQRLCATLTLALCSLGLAWSLALPLGIFAATYHRSRFDRATSALSYLFLSTPEFFLALLAVLLAARTGVLPTSGRTAIEHDFFSPWGKLCDYVRHLILPSAVLGFGNAARLFQLTRGYVLDFLHSEFVVTARAKGVSEARITFLHILRNALNPLVSHFGFALAGLLSGSLLTETIFNYPGLGQLLFEAFVGKDQAVVMASVVVGCVLLMMGNFVADVVLAIVDPRVRIGRDRAQ